MTSKQPIREWYVIAVWFIVLAQMLLQIGRLAGGAWSRSRWGMACVNAVLVFALISICILSVDWWRNRRAASHMDEMNKEKHVS